MSEQVTGEATSTPLGGLLMTALLGIAIVFAIVLTITLSVDEWTFTEWVSFFFMCATPSQIVLALLWHTKYPPLLNQMRQPAKGLALAGLIVLGGAIVAPVLLFAGGLGFNPPPPMLMMLTITTVATTLWVVPIWRVWPISAFTQHPLALGVGALMLAYGLAFLVFKLFFNYEFMAAAPVYVESLDPKGFFNAWLALSFIVTTVGVILVMMLFEFWPITVLVTDPSQPKFGIVGTIEVLAASAVLYHVFVGLLAWDPVDFMVRVPVCMIFGAFLVNNMMQGQLCANLAQPMRGVVLSALAVVMAVLMHALYAYAAALLSDTGTIPSGPPAYGLQIWIASAMLGVTFPIIILVSEFLDFWPIKRDSGASGR